VVAPDIWLLDTNVISEAAKSAPDETVMLNLRRFANELSICSIVLHELKFGWLRMPEGKRKRRIGGFLANVVSKLRVLPYDAIAANIHADIRAKLELKGLSLPFADGEIAAIAMANNATLVTLNVKDFEKIDGLTITDWKKPL
jgi:tRNA(fMet)-specific endonuclease VapC